MKNLNIGKFNQRVSLLQSVATPDGSGGFTQTWNNFATLWGFIEDYKSSENLVGETLRFIMKKKLIIRSQVGINPQMRCIINGKTYEITAIQPHNNMPSQWLELELQLMEGL